MNKESKPAFMFSSTQAARERWDYFVMCIATWNALLLPIELAYEPEWTKTSANTWINAFIDLLFLLDIIVVFRTAIVGENGEIVTD